MKTSDHPENFYSTGLMEYKSLSRSAWRVKPSG